MAKQRRLHQNENWTAFWFVLPALAPLVAFWIMPLILSLLLSFTNWDMISPVFKIVGLRNYLSLLKTPTFMKVLGNTLTFAAGSTIPTLVLGLLMALALSAARKGMGLYRTILFSPYITPMVAASIVWSWIFEPRVGILNFVFQLFGMGPLKWTQSMDTAMLSVIVVTVWKSLGWTMVFFLEAIRKVPASLLEAATIDGANGWNRFRNVTLPMISPTTFFLVIIQTIGSLQAYDQIQVLTQGGPAGATRTILYYYYQEAFTTFDTGKASAVAMFLVVITIALSLIETAASKRMVHYE